MPQTTSNSTDWTVTLRDWIVTEGVTPSRAIRDNQPIARSPRGTIRFTPLMPDSDPELDRLLSEEDEIARQRPRISAASFLNVPPLLSPEEPTERWLAPDRNLRVGDRVRWTPPGGGPMMHGEVAEICEPMERHELNRVPDWVPEKPNKHQTYRLRRNADGDRMSRVCWFRIQRLETNE